MPGWVPKDCLGSDGLSSRVRVQVQFLDLEESAAGHGLGPGLLDSLQVGLVPGGDEHVGGIGSGWLAMGRDGGAVAVETETHDAGIPVLSASALLVGSDGQGLDDREADLRDPNAEDVEMSGF